MQRRVPFSAKKKKAQLQQKRAIKRGDVSPPPEKPDKRRKRRGRGHDEAAPSASSLAAADSARRLQSSFVKLPKDFLEETKRLAANLPLPRPVPSDAAVWVVDDTQHISVASDGSERREQLTCPQRPKWRYEMTKKEVEKNEEGLFKKWLDQTDRVLDAWSSPKLPDEPEDDPDTPPVEAMPTAPTSFERNLEVWRQL